jgi:energy-coupling factor transporter ATP-binding protein EcfA2
VKIRAIRLKEVGPFSSPVALEGLSGRLDVLAGPNELGKSTLLRAMRMALAEKATSKASAVQALKPYTGGAPLIELEFEAEGKQWRLRKQFLSRPSVELEDRGSGRTLKGADADDRIEQLLRAGEDGRLGLLWVDQGMPLAPVTPAKTLGETLARAVEADVAAAADGSKLRRVRERVRAELAELVTPGRGQPTGRYMQAIKTHESLQREHEAALLRRQAAESRLDQLASLGTEIDALAEPGAMASREAAVERAEAEWVEAEAAEQQRRAAEQRVAAEIAALKFATQDAAAFSQRLAEHETLTRDASADDVLRIEIERAHAEAAQALMRLQHSRDDLLRSAADLQRDAKAVRAARVAEQLRVRHAMPRHANWSSTPRRRTSSNQLARPRRALWRSPTAWRRRRRPFP